MKHRNRVLAALLATLILLTFAAPLSQALESAPFAAIQGAHTPFMLFGKFKNDGSTDRNTRYFDFSSVTIENTNIAEAYMVNGMWYIFGKAADASSSFTATLPNGETLTGTIMSIKGNTRGSAWYGWGGYTTFAGLTPATSYVALGGAQNLNVIGTNKTNSAYTWTISGNAATLAINGNAVTVNASAGVTGTCTVTASDNAGNSFSATVYVYDPFTLALTAPASYTVSRGSAITVYPYPAAWYGPRGGTWNVSNPNITYISSYNRDNSVTIYGGNTLGTTTYIFTDTATRQSTSFTITVI